ncbi:MAG: helix-turn-helix domain-containing protein [Eubacteriales bacterium]
MQEQYSNIYETARKSSGLTQEKAAEKIGVSYGSIKDYESDKRIPPDDVVVRMVDIYDARYLAYQHIKENVKAAGSLIPSNVEIKDLPTAVLRLQKEVNDFMKVRDQMLDITCDGIISEEERPAWNKITKELDDISRAIMSLNLTKT